MTGGISLGDKLGRERSGSRLQGRGVTCHVQRGREEGEEQRERGKERDEGREWSERKERARGGDGEREGEGAG